ncbi:asparagine synthetase [glutamine-hydrolyzing] 1 [Pedobacter glucosidilyticus]|nr:asparagine synthase (glutamine-hydrolyzing) [Pedobacter glucosidilyticus]KHJ36995.1 asparagine synthetase [glutamine-hydrolyzing] 1 [Pedobacter glucosidilyticus]
MCRIAGIINKNFPNQELKEKIEFMTHSQKHGGPDDAGIFIDENHGLALGHRRLSILELSSLGHQPMFTKEHHYGLIFNGEIYNYKDLKKELEQLGSQFNSHSDTEVILKAFVQWGTDSFKKLRGMFAFALFDKREKNLYLVRDQQGIKPLYYHQDNNTLYFASEVKAFNCFAFSKAKNKDWPLAFLSFGHLPEPMTTVKNVWMLPKGHYLEVSLDAKNTSLQIKHYALQTENILNISLPEAQEEINHLLNNAIQKQLVADAPLGIFLSGGIDSSLLALQAAKYKQEKLITVSIHFTEAQYSEKKYQEIISKKLPGKHIEQEVNRKDFENYFDHILEHMDQPSTDGINTWFVSKAAHDAGLKAVLSGIGADELYGGYPSFNRVSKIPLLRKTSKIIGAFNRIAKNDALQRLNYLNNTNHTAFEYLFLRGFFSTEQLDHLFSIKKNEQYQAIIGLDEPKVKIPKQYDGKRASWFEQHYFMQNQLLKDADAMSMQHGLEIRVPFLDEDLVNFTNQIPESIIYDKKKPAKHLLINAFNCLLPQEIWNRPKMGFTFPFQHWLKTHPKYLSLKEKYSHHPVKQRLFQQYEKDKIHWSKIMSLLVLEKFNESF